MSPFSHAPLSLSRTPASEVPVGVRAKVYVTLNADGRYVATTTPDLAQALAPDPSFGGRLRLFAPPTTGAVFPTQITATRLLL